MKKKVALALFFENSANIDIVQKLSEKDILDIYALTLNQLPARYAHNTTIILNEHVRIPQIHSVIDDIIKHIQDNPKQ